MNKRVSIFSFKNAVWKYYRAHARAMPWRFEKDPYRVFVSEVMLQQTQVDRVRGKYEEFIKRFPDFRALAEAPLSAVLRAWQGLGYNRRALFLKRAAKKIMREHGGALPRSEDALRALPGIGAATASSIRAFAFNEPAVFIETNIRSVYLHFFFPKSPPEAPCPPPGGDPPSEEKKVSDKKLLPLVEKTLDRANPREWYYALMDYGAMLKRNGANPSRASATHKKQARFEGSLRQTRGAVVRLLVRGGASTEVAIRSTLGTDSSATQQALSGLVEDGLLCKKGNRYTIVGATTHHLPSAPRSRSLSRGRTDALNQS